MITNVHVNRAIDYVLDNVDGELSVDGVASHCNFSRHYFSRLFKRETGESVGGFIRRMKMERSAFRLLAVHNRGEQARVLLG